MIVDLQYKKLCMHGIWNFQSEEKSSYIIILDPDDRGPCVAMTQASWFSKQAVEFPQVYTSVYNLSSGGHTIILANNFCLRHACLPGLFSFWWAGSRFNDSPWM